MTHAIARRSGQRETVRRDEAAAHRQAIRPADSGHENADDLR